MLPAPHVHFFFAFRHSPTDPRSGRTHIFFKNGSRSLRATVSRWRRTWRRLNRRWPRRMPPCPAPRTQARCSLASPRAQHYSHSHRPRATGHGPRATGHGPQMMGRRPGAIDHEPRATGHRPHGPRATGHWLMRGMGWWWYTLPRKFTPRTLCTGRNQTPGDSKAR